MAAQLRVFRRIDHEKLMRIQRTTQLAGTQDAPVRNVLVVIENRSGFFYNYVSGYVTFYGSDGVRCGEGLWKADALAPGERMNVWHGHHDLFRPCEFAAQGVLGGDASI